MTPFDLQASSVQSLNLEQMFKGHKLFLYPYARYALFALLSRLRIKSIYLPDLICRDLLAPVNSLGIRISFYEVDPNLNPCIKDIKADAILSVNYFGFAQDLSEFRIYCNKHDAVLIEDNAHGFLSRSNDGQYLGTRGDFGLFSFRKTCFLPNGAGLLVNNAKYLNEEFLSARIEQTKEDKRFEKKNKFKKFIHITSPLIGMSILRFLRLIRKLRTRSYIPKPDQASEHELRLNDRLTPLLGDSKISLDPVMESERRRIMFNRVVSYAEQFKIEPLFKKLNLFDVPFVFPFRAQIKDKNLFEKFLFKRSFYVLPWPDFPEKTGSRTYDCHSNLWVVPFLW